MMKSLALLAILAPVLCACDTGPYDPSAHRHADASTGSMLSGADTGTEQNGSLQSSAVGFNHGEGGPR